MPLRNGRRPVWMLAREGEHIGAVQAFRNSMPPSARRSMFGVFGAVSASS